MISPDEYTTDDFDTPTLFDRSIKGQVIANDTYTGEFYRENGTWYWGINEDDWTTYTPRLPESPANVEVIQ